MAKYSAKRSPLLQSGELNSFMTYLFFNIESRSSIEMVFWIGLEVYQRFLGHFP
jgi:hypothetical protein